MAEDGATAASTRKCPKCGEENPLEALVCGHCQLDLTATATATATAAAAATQATPAQAGAGTAGPGPGVPPGTAPAMPTWTAQTVVGMTIALAGGGLVFVASFLPWLRHPNVTLTGWDLVDTTRRGGGNPLLIMNAFADFDPMVTGLTTAILGGLMAMLAVVVLVAPKQLPPSRAWVPDEVILIMVPIMGCAMLAAIFNLVSAVSPNASSTGVEVGYGLFVLCAGVVVWLVGMLVEMSRPPSTIVGAGRGG
jgi:hypothetical protein